jgi:putative ABC transport system permease protein
VIGQKITLDGRDYSIIGVAPRGFRGLTGQAEVWVPFVMSGSAEDLAQRGDRGFVAVARLRPGLTLAGAQAEMDAISSRLAKAYPGTNEARGVELISLADEIFGDLRKPLLVLLAAVGFVLLIASTNVANLLLARSEARQREVAMRTALGASRGRLVRQLLTEIAILVGCGCVAGLALAHYGILALMAASPLNFPSFVQPSIDLPVALFAILICSLVALALGLAPIAGGYAAAINQGTNRSTGGRRGSRIRDWLVIAEISVSLLLLVGAGLMIRSLARLAALDPGYDPSRVAMMRVHLPEGRSVAANDILRQVTALPSVESACIATDAPLAGSNAVIYTAEGQPPMNAQTVPRAFFHRISPDFFRTLRIPLVAGRYFTEQEMHDKANVAIVTENLVNRFWKGEDPIGRRVKVGGVDSARPWLTIVGVITEIKYRGLPNNPTADPDLFQTFNEASRDFSVMVRTSAAPSSMLAGIRAALCQTEPSLLIYNVGTLEESVGEKIAPSQIIGSLMTIFAALALFLAVIGIYGVLSYTVSRRTREIGVRVALGADRGTVLRMVAARGMRLVAFGILLGAAAALVLTQAMAALIYGVSTTDPLTFAAAAAVLAMVAMVACVLPASRASRIDPSVTLRNE